MSPGRPVNPFDDPTLTLPCSEQCEQSVLGAVFLDNVALGSVRRILAADDFYRDDHRRIFRVICNLADRGSAVDPLTVMEELRRTAALDGIGGPAGPGAYLGALPDGVPKSANAEHYARIVKEKALLRATMRAAQAVIQNAADRNGAGPGQELEGILAAGAALRQTLDSLSQLTPTLPDLADRLALPEHDTRWAIRDLVEFGAASLGSGAAKIGKSSVCVAGLLAVASSTPFAGRFLTQQSPVLYIDAELGERRALALIRRLARGEGIDAADLAHKEFLHYVDATRTGTARDPSGWARLVRERGIGLVLIDPAVALFAGDENAAVEVRAWWTATIRPLLDEGAGVLVVHHSRKGLAGIQDSTSDSARGSGDWRGAPDLHFDVRRDPLDRRVLKLEVTGSRLGIEPEPFLLRLEDHNGGTRVRWVGAPQESAGKTLAAADAIERLIVEAGDGGLRRQDIKAALASRFSKRTLDDALAEVRERGHVEVRRVGKASVYRRREA